VQGVQRMCQRRATPDRFLARPGEHRRRQDRLGETGPDLGWERRSPLRQAGGAADCVPEVGELKFKYGSRMNHRSPSARTVTAAMPTLAEKWRLLNVKRSRALMTAPTETAGTEVSDRTVSVRIGEPEFLGMLRRSRLDMITQQSWAKRPAEVIVCAQQP
jgi:hypothetical protein